MFVTVRKQEPLAFFFTEKLLQVNVMFISHKVHVKFSGEFLLICEFQLKFSREFKVKDRYIM